MQEAPEESRETDNESKTAEARNRGRRKETRSARSKEYNPTVLKIQFPAMLMYVSSKNNIYLGDRDGLEEGR